MLSTSRVSVFPRFVGWMAIGVAAAFTVVATQAFGASAAKWLAAAIGLGTMFVSLGVSLGYRRHLATLVTGLATAVVGAWTVVASLVFAGTTGQYLILASALATCALAAVGITAHELSAEGYVITRVPTEAPESTSALPAAA